MGRNGALCNVCKPTWDHEKEDVCGRCFQSVHTCSCTTEMIEQAGCTAFYKLVYYRHGDRSIVQNKVIYRIKNQRDRRTHRFLAQEFAALLDEKIKDWNLSDENAVITYIPRRRSVILECGTDQAQEIARALSKRLHIPLSHCIYRTHTKQMEQKTLTPQGRWKNVKAAFAIRRGAVLKGKTVFLIDDIVTTGASMTACIKKLKRAGASKIYCVAVASDESNQYPSVPQLSKRTDFVPLR